MKNFDLIVEAATVIFFDILDFFLGGNLRTDLDLRDII